MDTLLEDQKLRFYPEQLLNASITLQWPPIALNTYAVCTTEEKEFSSWNSNTNYTPAPV